MTDWRADPTWTLVHYDPRVYPPMLDPPPERPTPSSELSTSPDWASEYRDGIVAATWYRHVPLTPADWREITDRTWRRGRGRRQPRQRLD